MTTQRSDCVDAIPITTDESEEENREGEASYREACKDRVYTCVGGSSSMNTAGDPDIEQAWLR